MDERATGAVIWHALPGPVQEVQGTVEVPTSKSFTNRALIAAAVADGGVIEQPLDCEDTRLLASALDQAGWQVLWKESISLKARRRQASGVQVDLGNSGTGARLILSLLATVPGRTVVDGTSRLRERPMGPLIGALEYLGASLESADGGLPVTIHGGTLRGGVVELSPGVSSQFVTSLVMAAPLMREGLDLRLVGEVPSRPYLDLTEDVLRAYGADLEVDDGGRRWRVGTTPLRKMAYTVEGDWSAVAFMAAAVAVAGGQVDVGPLDGESRQGDRAVCGWLAAGGVSLEHRGDRLHLSGRATHAIKADLRDTPDAFPALAVVACSTVAGSELSGLEHLKHKESDRLGVMVDNLHRLGARVEVDGSAMRVIEPFDRGPRNQPVRLTSAGDHRIAMAMAVAGLVTAPLQLDDVACVQKSFPTFWDQWRRLAGGRPVVVS